MSFFKLSYPTATLKKSSTFCIIALRPIATWNPPVVIFSPAPLPTRTLLLPVVITVPAKCPIATLSSPVVNASRASIPKLVLFEAVPVGAVVCPTNKELSCKAKSIPVPVAHSSILPELGAFNTWPAEPVVVGNWKYVLPPVLPIFKLPCMYASLNE